MKTNRTSTLLWISFVVQVAYLVLVVLGTIFQRFIKYLFSSPTQLSDTFTIPIDSIIVVVLNMSLLLLFTLLISSSLKQQSHSIASEVIGIVLFLSVLPILQHILYRVVTTFIGINYGTTALASYGILNSFIGICNIVSQISIGLFLVACGMSIASKRA